MPETETLKAAFAYLRGVPQHEHSLITLAYVNTIRRALHLKGGFGHNWGLAITCHEIAHWILAPRHRRGECCFGLGLIQCLNCCGQSSVSYVDADREERQASILGIAILSKFDVAEAWDTLREHNWLDDYEWNRFTKGSTLTWNLDPSEVVMELTEKGLWPAEKVLDILFEELGCHETPECGSGCSPSTH